MVAVVLLEEVNAHCEVSMKRVAMAKPTSSLELVSKKVSVVGKTSGTASPDVSTSTMEEATSERPNQLVTFTTNSSFGLDVRKLLPSLLCSAFIAEDKFLGLMMIPVLLSLFALEMYVASSSTRPGVLRGPNSQRILMLRPALPIDAAADVETRPQAGEKGGDAERSALGCTGGSVENTVAFKVGV